MSVSLFSRVKRIGSALTLISLLTACSVFSGDDGRNDPSKLTEYPAGLSARIGWTASVGSIKGSYGFAPTVVRDAVYAAAADGTVGKFDISSGAPVWKVNVDKKLSAGAGSDGVVTAVVATDGTVIALDDSGKVKWSTKASSDVQIPPVVGFGVVVVRSGDYRIQAFNAENGERIWNVQRPGPSLTLRAPARLMLVEGLVLSGIPGGKLVALNALSGDTQWEGIVAAPKGSTDLERVNDVVGSPALIGPLLCAVAHQGRVICFDISQGGRPVWSVPFSSNVGMAVDNRFAYAPNTQDVISAFALQDGKVVWKQDALRNRKLTAPAATGSAIAVGDYDGFVHFISSEDGRMLARLSVGGGAIRAPLTATPQGVLVQTGDGSLIMIVTN
ncbi:outer membrane protein assembly factor BamB [Orrella sp. NBD-18]|uniref:Outer membrane protein assembly factor BamB n=1 Tax=Sheuella amnicola TaxID=2707330 RepID=A0A6B2R098_9BURK|nr:outer membrane protein assembly factor BamB [Sheuella amnicola]NDY83563.1 outer membrane protein assembly factor BamB [Sheuella amnicola]